MRQSNLELKYIELKSGYTDDGPAWIGRVKRSKSGNTVYFNDKAFSRSREGSGNYFDVETYESYWISGVKKNGCDRHWAGKGKVQIDRKVIDEYLAVTGAGRLDEKMFEIIELEDVFPVERINRLVNKEL